MQNKVRKQRGGFTLVEVLIVVVILGILAATVLPQFANTSESAREAALVQNLQTLRSQIQMYKFQHQGKYPGDGNTFEDVMTMASKADGSTAAPGTPNYPYGPYILGKLPPNPYHKDNSNTVDVKTVALLPADYDGTSAFGWVFSTVTGELRANIDSTLTGTDGTILNEF